MNKAAVSSFAGGSKLKYALWGLLGILIGLSIYFCLNIRQKQVSLSSLQRDIAIARHEKQTLFQAGAVQEKRISEGSNYQESNEGFLDELMMQCDASDITIETIGATTESNAQEKPQSIFVTFSGEASKIFDCVNSSANKLPSDMRLVKLEAQKGPDGGDSIVSAEFRRMNDL